MTDSWALSSGSLSSGGALAGFGGLMGAGAAALRSGAYASGPSAVLLDALPVGARARGPAPAPAGTCLRARSLVCASSHRRARPARALGPRALPSPAQSPPSSP